MNPLFAQFVGIDPRSLAALRMGLGAVLLVDLFDRVRDLTAHYTDAGVLPRTVWVQTMGPWRVSLHLMSGLSGVQGALMALAAALAVMMIVGWRTRLATLGSWAVLASLHSRNPLVLNAGDQLLLLLLLWCALLPTGRVWSIDRVVRGEESGERDLKPEFSIATAGLLFQIAATYFVSAVLKTGREWRVDGTAVYFALSNGHFASRWAEFILPYYGVLKALTFSTMALEFVGPIAAFVPVRWAWVRTGVAVSFMLFHAGLWVFMEIGIFPLVCIVAWFAFLPGAFWDALGRAAAAGWIGRVLSRVGAGVRSVCGPGRVRRAPSHRVLRTTGEIVVQCAAGALFAYVLFWNIATVIPEASLPSEAKRPAWVLRFDQEWRMFAPFPRRRDAWLVVEAVLADGSTVDLARSGRTVSLDRPQDFREIYPRYRWRKYTSNIWREQNRAHLRSYVRWLAREWDRVQRPEKRATRVSAVIVYRELLPEYQTGQLRVERLVSIDLPQRAAEGR